MMFNGATSTGDEQLLLSVAFKDTVNIEAISFVAPLGEKAPLTVKLYSNANNVGFDNCESLTPTQEFQLTPEDLAPDAMTALYKVKFQRINNLTVGWCCYQSPGICWKRVLRVYKCVANSARAIFSLY
jgi:hypothetical protein